eukprot:CAMPEP_0203739904 /NCGR_PEP_ID=MMETSP0092-20131115/47783_1 /ASSEMBLY_ACC=CAM_ASM_001090 /TAXON_ID=426623 /ORGANISM="Chaetoceros affinis, Strain CCMP159" /LENGTH=40 /DNA_ID= /DNA_START= /DNA_END= /DNA_ORIENTATION=
MSLLEKTMKSKAVVQNKANSDNPKSGGVSSGSLCYGTFWN